MRTRDGVRLDADVYRPVGVDLGPLPVLLMRQPYGRAIASTVVYAHPRWYAAQGYIVVIQDVRGRGSSEGPFKLFATDVEDGEDSIAWAAGLPGSNGRVGMYGFSYQGMTQLYAAARQPEALKALCPAMLAYDLYSDWAYEGGAFCLQAGLAWAVQLAAETARLAGDIPAYDELAAAAKALPIGGEVASQPEILARLAPNSFYHDWVEHSQGDESYWQSLVPNLTDVELPMLHIGGWFDPYLRGSLNLFHRVACESSPLRMQSPQHLYVGPWGHLPWNRRVGALDFGPAAASPIDHLQIRWFDQFLKGLDTGLLAEQPVQLFEMGQNRWRGFDHWPSAANGFVSPTSDSSSKSRRSAAIAQYRLESNGLAAMREDGGQLKYSAETYSEPASVTATTEDVAVTDVVATRELAVTEDIIVHDPWRPVPSQGGHNGLPNGPFERSAIDGRSDVVTYTTEPLEQELAIAGDITLWVHCDSDAPSFDLCAVLSEVHADGKVFNFSQGYLRVPASEKLAADRPYRINLQPTCMSLAQGHALRLSLSGACFPAYAVNPGSGQHPNVTAQIENRVITLRILTGPATPSALLLPLV